MTSEVQRAWVRSENAAKTCQASYCLQDQDQSFTAKFVQKTHSTSFFEMDVMIVPYMFGTIIQDRAITKKEFVRNVRDHFSRL